MSESATNSSEPSSVPTRPTLVGVALDMDGLLFDTEKLYWQVGDAVLQRRGYRYSAELQQRMMGRIGLDAVGQMIEFHRLDDEPQQLLDESDEIYGNLLRDGLQPMPGLAEWIGLLQSLKMPFGLATSSRRKFVEIIFESVDWGDSLAFQLTGDDVTQGKPNPEMYLKAAERLGVEPATMLVLEDSGNGCASAVAAGAYTIAIPSEHTRDQDFSGAKLIADSLLDERLWKLVKR